MTDINIGKLQGAASPVIYTSPTGGVRAEIAVNDDKLRSLGIDHDGFEKPFALIPLTDGSWRRVDLNYVGSWANRGSSAISDRFAMSVGQGDGTDLNEINKRGIAFGLEVHGQNGANPSTVWLQSPDDNYKPLY